MTKITIDDKEYDSDNLSEDQNKIIQTLNVGQNAITLFNHMLQCADAIQTIKTKELKDSLEEVTKDKK